MKRKLVRGSKWPIPQERSNRQFASQLQLRAEMAEDLKAQFEKALLDRGNALAIGMGFTVGDYLGQDDVNVSVAGSVTTDPGKRPPGLPRRGLLLTHTGTLVAPRDDEFRMGWFLGEALRSLLETAAGSSEAVADKASGLANELADILATDKYNFASTAAQVSEDLWNDFLGGTLPPQVMWLKFQLAGLPSGPADLWLAHPYCVLERMFGPNQGAKPISESTAQPAAPATPFAMPELEEPQAPVSPGPVATVLSANVRRLLRTHVPVIVTLADKKLAMGKLLDIGPGSIIEFERPCDEPLQLSVNNLPIGIGEAVKIGDHFGLKVTAILSAEERIAALAEKIRT